MSSHPLGRLTPTDWKHVSKYPLRAVRGATVQKVEKILPLPYYHWQHDQGNEGACVGFGASMMMAIMNERQARANSSRPFVHIYNCFWLYREAQKVDEWEGEAYSGTSVRAGMDVLRTLGHVRNVRRVDQPASIAQGLKENRWAITIDEMRTAIFDGTPITIGVNWYRAFDEDHIVKRGPEYFITDKVDQLGILRGGHCTCLHGASDRRQAFKMKNSWGKDYPLVWMPYMVMDMLLRQEGEATIVTDL